MDNQQFEFESVELGVFAQKIRDESRKLIEETIKKHSPIQIDDIVTECYGEKQKLQVTEINLYGIDAWESSFARMSFSYWGLPVKKNGSPMLNRKPVWFSTFIFNGVKYNMPSYNRKEIINATMIKK